MSKLCSVHTYGNKKDRPLLSLCIVILNTLEKPLHYTTRSVGILLCGARKQPAALIDETGLPFPLFRSSL